MSGERMHAVTMPRWGMTMTEGLVASWLVEPGQAVEAGQELLEIETSKIANVVEAAASGVLRRRVVDAGATAPVGALLGVLAPAETPDAEIDAFVAENASAAAEAGEAAVAPATETVDIGGGRVVAYIRTGSGDGGPPVVLIHGFGGDRTNWLFNQDALAEGRQAYALDLPGHGESSLPGDDASPEGLARDVAAVLDGLGIEAAHLVGHSLGGAVALAFAAAAPGRVRSLSLLAPAGLGTAVDRGYVDAFLAAGRRKPMKEALSRLFADPSVVTGEMVEQALGLKRQDGVPEALRSIADAAFGEPPLDLGGALAGLAAPVLLVTGEEDGVIPPASAADLPQGARAVRLPVTGHMPHMERAAEVNRAVAAHIGEAP